MAVEQANVKSTWGKTLAQEERHAPSELCPNPSRWTMYDPLSPEIEVMKFIRSLVRTTKPEKVVTVGDSNGHLSVFLAQALRENGAGKVTILKVPIEAAEAAKGMLFGSGVSRFIELREDESIDTDTELDLVVIDVPEKPNSTRDPKEAQDFIGRHVTHFAGLMKRDGLIIVHDTTDLETPTPEMSQKIQLHTPRGLTLIQIYSK